MKNLLEKLDFFSPKPEIKVNGNTRFRTSFGIITGICFLCVLLSIYSIYLYNCFYRFKKIVTYNEKRDSNPRVPLNKMKFSITLMDGYGREYSDHEKIFEISAKFWESKLVDPSKVNLEYVDNFEYGKIDNIPLKKCNEFQDKNFIDSFSNLAKLKKTTKCLELDNFQKDLFGRYGSLDK